MRKIVEVKDGLDSLLGERVTFWCANYIYTGKLVGVNETCAKLTDASVVYETGELTTKEWTDAQPLPHDWYVMLNAVESFGIMK